MASLAGKCHQRAGLSADSSVNREELGVPGPRTADFKGGCCIILSIMWPRLFVMTEFPKHLTPSVLGLVCAPYNSLDALPDL